MDKIAILSDIHGNITALNAVLEDIKKRNINRIFCLGDNITKCTHPDLVIDKVKQVCEVLLIGNCDYSICNLHLKTKTFGLEILLVKKELNSLHLCLFLMNFI